VSANTSCACGMVVIKTRPVSALTTLTRQTHRTRSQRRAQDQAFGKDTQVATTASVRVATTTLDSIPQPPMDGSKDRPAGFTPSATNGLPGTYRFNGLKTRLSAMMLGVEPATPGRFRNTSPAIDDGKLSALNARTTDVHYLCVALSISQHGCSARAKAASSRS
jgi:hypothetical protein